ncbi:MAG: hypothetical protein H6822_12195 [Planctomycetaceae bacterium]|nr:hypothetical protein [Planctomycetales bacterium]MCB9922938.1 hypothetical protein [Planctomycetaceae bacterium]
MLDVARRISIDAFNEYELTLLPDVDLYTVYLHQRVNGASAPGRNGTLFNSIDWAVNWHF